MKKAIIEIKDKQYLVSSGDLITVDLLNTDRKTTSFKPLLVIDEGDKILIGEPEVSSAIVKAKIINPDIKQDKVIAIRYKAKKRVHKIRGHRQRKTILEISSISKTTENHSKVTTS